ncbi:hypothetical protein [Methanobacterium ferruginis]|uniref:hypothetical protein n=1 Tax=Methanobacterium ferruginis TaxID=710191 RepID=UPI00257255F3|nr:hypothetical protein [Methanobacterium ferruginis]BDZ68794.1 hypothetical protein GCM10025860_22420 [Methanobacterium ferruginis]
MTGVAAADNVTTTQTNTTSDELPVSYSSTLGPWYHIPSMGTGFIVGYYINPRVTPISEINFTALKDAGITDIYVLANNNNYSSVLPEAKERADTVGIKTHAWVYPGFSHASEVAQMKIGVQLDVETYDMPDYLSEIKAMRQDTEGVPFSLAVKPERWDGNQYYYLIAPYCDYIVPMLYIADYDEGVTGLRNWAEFYNFIYPGKIVAGLETYESDQNLTPKDQTTVLEEINAVQYNTHGVILFRYGLSEFHD